MSDRKTLPNKTHPLPKLNKSISKATDVLTSFCCPSLHVMLQKKIQVTRVHLCPPPYLPINKISPCKTRQTITIPLLAVVKT